MNYAVRWSDSNVSVRFEGAVTFTDVEDSGNNIFGDERFDSIELAIFDFSRATSLNLSKMEIRVISTLDSGASRWNERLKLALVTNKNSPRITKILAIYMRFMKGNNWKIELFEEAQDALKWR